MSEKQPNWNAHGEVVVLEVLIQFCRSKVGELNFKEVADRNLRVKKKSERRKVMMSVFQVTGSSSTLLSAMPV